MKMKQKDILQFWRDVEIFNLPDFEQKGATLLEKNTPFPWEMKRKNKEKIKKKYKKLLNKDCLYLTSKVVLHLY